LRDRLSAIALMRALVMTLSCYGELEIVCVLLLLLLLLFFIADTFDSVITSSWCRYVGCSRWHRK